MKEVFISHSSKERARAVDICNILEKNGITCWIAPRNVIGGMPYAEEIVRAIKNCKIVLLIASVSINESEQIMNEIEIAVNNSKIILPFKIDEVEYNDSYKYYLNRKHWIEAIPNPKDFYSLLIEEIKYLLSSDKISSDTVDDTYLQTLANFVAQEEFFEGKRVLLDFMENFGRDDCVFVGNTFSGFVPIACENHESENYRARTFRFNVGALHQYIMVSETETRYLNC